MQALNLPKAFSTVLTALVAIGIGCWVFQLVGGLAVTGMSNTTSWGLYIAYFMLFVGLSAGGLIVASSAHVFNIASFKKVSLPVAILVHSVTAWIFGLQIAHEGWYSAIMAPIFVASAMDSGLALLLVSLIGLEKMKLYEVDSDLFSSLVGVIALGILGFMALSAFILRKRDE